MLSAARGKCDADFRRAALPGLAVEGEFDAVVAIRGVVNHLPPEDLAPALESLAGCLADSGVLVFDNSPLPPAGNHPALDMGSTERGDYARIAQHVPTNEHDDRERFFTPLRPANAVNVGIPVGESRSPEGRYGGPPSPSGRAGTNRGEIR